jgi:hypothetical protein
MKNMQPRHIQTLQQFHCECLEPWHVSTICQRWFSPVQRWQAKQQRCCASLGRIWGLTTWQHCRRFDWVNRVCRCERVSTKYVPLYRHIPEKGPNMQKPSKTLAITGMRAKHTARDYRGYVVFFMFFPLLPAAIGFFHQLLWHPVGWSPRQQTTLWRTSESWATSLDKLRHCMP